MGEELELYQTLTLIIKAFLTVLELGLAAIVLLRFKATAAGIMLAVGFGGVAFLAIVAMLVGRLMGHGTDPDTSMIIFTGFDALSILLLIVVAVGIGFIPKALRTVAQK